MRIAVTDAKVRLLYLTKPLPGSVFAVLLE